MPIPDNLDPARALALCFGIKLPKRLDKRAKRVAAERISEFFGLPRDSVSNLTAAVEKTTEDIGIEPGPDGWLELPELAEGMLSVFSTVVQPWMESVSTGAWRRFDELVASSPLPDSIFEPLVMGLTSRMLQQEGDPAKAPRRFAADLRARHPDAYDRACILHWRRTRQFPEAAPGERLSDDSERSRFLQTRARIMHYLESAQEHLCNERPRAAAEAALKAASDALPGLLAEVCEFLHIMARALSASTPQPPPADPDALFQWARTWCVDAGFEFPFHEQLSALLLSHARADARFADDAIEFRDTEGQTIVVLSGDSLVERIRHDILFAWHFPDGLVWAQWELLEREGELDRVWDEAVRIIPELVTAVTERPRRRARRPRARPHPTTAPPPETPPDRLPSLELVRDLPDLFLQMFSPLELRLWLVQHFGADLLNFLPPESAPPAEIALQTALALIRRYDNADRIVLSALLAARPNKRQALLSIASKYGLEVK